MCTLVKPTPQVFDVSESAGFGCPFAFTYDGGENIHELVDIEGLQREGATHTTLDEEP